MYRDALLPPPLRYETKSTSGKVTETMLKEGHTPRIPVLYSSSPQLAGEKKQVHVIGTAYWSSCGQYDVMELNAMLAFC